MAGAGYKLFNTGDVLTAAQVNTYLMEQTVMVFANAAARTTALSGVVSEGMISYLKDTNAVEVYDGSNWVSSDDPNAIQNTIVDAKGDLISASAADVPARLAVGNNGETLVADSSASTGLRWQGNFAAGKNAIINGDFRIWQRGTSFTSTGYTVDRFRTTYSTLSSGGSMTVSQQTFTPGTAPVAGYEGLFFTRLARTSSASNSTVLSQPIEDVRTFAGQTVTLSYWAKVSSGTTTNEPSYIRNYGSGGSTQEETVLSAVTLTTSWQRFSHTFTVPSVSGKTIGSGSFLEPLVIRNVNSVSTTIDIWGVQLEAGNTATAFQTATGTLAGELAACQRYFISFGGVNFESFGMGQCISTTRASIHMSFPVQMRGNPTFSASGNCAVTSASNVATIVTASSTDIMANKSAVFAVDVASGLVAGNATRFIANNDTNARVTFSAEL